jgi:hypothetical protein
MNFLVKNYNNGKNKIKIVYHNKLWFNMKSQVPNYTESNILKFTKYNILYSYKRDLIKYPISQNTILTFLQNN